MESILLTKQNSIATITFNRPEVFNAFNAVMRQDFIAALDNCAYDPSVRCVIITGAGKAFCAGQDLAEIVDKENCPPFTEILDTGFNFIALKIRQLEKPVIAAVNGVAAGAGANIALACDIVLAHEDANFIQAFSKIGLIPDTGGTFTLPRIVGMARATAFMFLGEKIKAKDAEQMGMIYRCYTTEHFEENVKGLAKSLANLPTRALALTKQALNASLTNSFEQQLATESKLQQQAAQTDDYTEGVAAFLEKRKAQFTGK
jgi:2-(1,2-epoxy-1,2-dihydrophenyl)acetyl-CoA isomerase